MVVSLMNYEDEKMVFEIGDIDDIYLVTIDVISGDEIMTVIHKNGRTERFDSCQDGRTMDFHDCSYIAYMPGVRNAFSNKEWINRKSSYDNKWEETV